MATRAGYEGLETIPSTVDLAAAETEGGAPASATGVRPPRVSASGASRYEWLALLGEGGMGRVERMRDRDLLRDVAVKHLLPELRGEARLLEQFLWEARVTAHLDHPNIVPVHDLAAAPDGQLYFTMKLVRGASLDAVLARARDDRAPHERTRLHRRLRLFLPLCNAVAFAHSRGVLHRDLKPANVLVGEFGEVLVGDWGLAIPFRAQSEALAAAAPPWIASQSAGTPAYMSPEQIAGDTLDERSDVYTLGVILYELVSLSSAFRATSVAEVLEKVRRGDVAPLSRIAPDVPRSLTAVVEKAMALARDDRYATAEELAGDVETVLDGRSPDAEAAALPTRAARYYLGRDPAMAKLRVVDIDLWTLSSMLAGAAGALLLVRWLGPFWWALGLASVLAGLPPTARWLRLRRAREREHGKRTQGRP